MGEAEPNGRRPVCPLRGADLSVLACWRRPRRTEPTTVSPIRSFVCLAPGPWWSPGLRLPRPSAATENTFYESSRNIRTVPEDIQITYEDDSTYTVPYPTQEEIDASRKPVHEMYMEVTSFFESKGLSLVFLTEAEAAEEVAKLEEE